jgi:hypothetical protein
MLYYIEVQVFAYKGVSRAIEAYGHYGNDNSGDRSVCWGNQEEFQAWKLPAKVLNAPMTDGTATWQ